MTGGVSIESSGGRRAGDEGLLRGDLERHLEKAGRGGVAEADVENWAAERGLADLLEGALDALRREGTAVRWNRRWLAVRHTDWTPGKVRAVSRGGALLLTGLAGEAGYFIPERGLKGARDGDQVLVKPSGPAKARRRSSRDRGRLPEASVVKILSRGFETLVGYVDEDDPRELVPFDSRTRLVARLERSSRSLAGRFVSVRLDRSARSGAAKVPAAVEKDLGPPDEPGTDVRVVLEHFGIPDEISEAAKTAAAELPDEPRAEDLAGRRDLRSWPTITIDGATARDFDDAISVSRRRNGFSLAVHIADVGHYVREGSVLDLEAYERGTSVYFPDRAIPMLPEALSNGLCSLKPGVDRLTMTAFLEFSRDGKLERRRFAETVIRSDRRFTYSEVRDLLEGTAPGGVDREAPETALKELLETARDLMAILFRRRTERGSIDFDLPEGNVILDTEGVTVGVKPGERNVAHRIIEEFMISANEAVAAELEGAEVPALYRVHTEPDRARFEELKSFLEPLGIPLDLGPEELHPSHLQEVLERVRGHDEEPFVATLILRSMKRAAYDPECLGHYALSSRHYTHFTSPIRRYPDLVVHRGLKRRLCGRPWSDEERAALVERLPAMAEHTSSMERRAERAERALLQWKVIRLLAPRVGEVFVGRVTGVQKFGLFIQLEDYYVDSLLPIAALTDDYYRFEPENHRLVGRSGRVLRLADRLEVVLDKADPIRRLLTVRPAGAGFEPPSGDSPGTSRRSSGSQPSRRRKRRRDW